MGEVEPSHEFLAITTHPRIVRTPTPEDAALDQVSAWLESPLADAARRTRGRLAGLRGQLAASRVDGPRVHDARIAALCLSQGVRGLWTAGTFHAFSH